MKPIIILACVVIAQCMFISLGIKDLVKGDIFFGCSLILINSVFGLMNALIIYGEIKTHKHYD